MGRTNKMRVSVISIILGILLIAFIGVATIVTNNQSQIAFAEPHDHSGWTAWTTTTSLPTVAGNYNLTADVSISDTWVVPTGTVNLCLCGHGIRMTGNNSVVTINAGATLKLYDCDTTTEHKYSLSYAKSNGAGFATVNNGLTSGYQTFKGGYITGGTGTAVSSWNRGGAFYINDGTVEMYGGTVIGNGQYDVTHGGAFNTQGSGTFRMYGGSIQNNAGKCGGATRLQGGSCEIYGGKIINNIVSADGGAIHVGGKISVILQDCEISGNYAVSGPGAGIWMTTTGMVISGRTIITDNLTNSGESNVEIGNGNDYVIGVGELTDGATIGIKPQRGAGIFTSGWSTNMNGKDPADYFTSDIADYTVIKDNNGELMMIPENAVAVVKNGTAFTYYIDFNSALSAWGDGCTLTLLKDVIGQVTVTSGTKTLDLNNHSITYSSGSVIIVSGGLLTICDNSENKTVHYYLPNQNGVATLSATKTDYYFEGGYVTGGVATQARGGGLRVLGTGSVVFGGGTLFANSAGWGGGLWSSENSSVTIEGTAAIIGNYSSGDYTSGGGIFMEGSSAVTMTGGSIRHNSAQWSGGGVRDCVSENTGVRFTMTGGEITGNYAKNNQGNGFCFDAATTFNIGGTARIIDNQGSNDVYMYNDRYLTIVSPFKEGALIGVTLQSGTGTFTSGWSDKMGDADPADYFTSDNASYSVGSNPSGEAVLGIICTVTFNVNGHGVAPQSTSAVAGSVITAPTDPTDNDYVFDGWFKEEGLQNEWDFATDTVGENITLYAKWKEKPHEHDGIVFEAWTSTNSLPTSGNYYLTADVTISGNWWGISQDVSLCLNGYGITALQPATPSYSESICVILLYNDVEFNLCDCGTRRHYFDVDESGLAVNINEQPGEGRLSFTGGYLAGGYADEVSWTSCGGVEVYGDNVTFNMYGGTIIGNYGGAIYTGSSTFNMYGGDVCYNVNYATAGCGGVHVGGGPATISGGSIHHNTSNYAGGLMISYFGNATVTITGGSIVDNKALYDDGYGGVADNTNRVVLSGDPIITGNTADGAPSDFCLYVGDTIAIGGSIAPEARIGVRLLLRKGVVTSGLNGRATVDNFINNVDGYLKRINDDGEIEFYPAHIHDWTYSVQNGVITATCTAEGCSLSEPQTLTITAQGKPYDGRPVTATMTKSDGWTPGNGLATPEIMYSGNTIAGTYTASIQVGDVTASVEFTIEPRNVVPICGIVKNKDDNPLADVTISVKKGGQTIESTKTTDDGAYLIVVPAGVYNVVVEYDNCTETFIVALFEDEEKNIVLSDANDGKTESKLEVVTEEGEEIGIAVGGLDEEARSIRENDPTAENKDVSVVMIVEPKEEEDATKADEILEQAEDKSLKFFEIKVEKTVDQEKTTLDETSHVLEIVIPYAKTNKRGLIVYSYHGNAVRTFVESETKEDGTFRVDKENGLIYVYANKFSTYAIGYTPYYSVKTSLTLGSYQGTATVTLQNRSDEKIAFTKENVDTSAIEFEDVPKGQYTMTITWTDGKTNTLTMSMTVGPKPTFAPKTEEEAIEEEPAEDEGEGDTEPDNAACLVEAEETEFAAEEDVIELTDSGYQVSVPVDVAITNEKQETGEDVRSLPRKRDDDK